MIAPKSKLLGLIIKVKPLNKIISIQKLIVTPLKKYHFLKRYLYPPNIWIARNKSNKNMQDLLWKNCKTWSKPLWRAK